MRRVISLWLPRFPTDRLCRRQAAKSSRASPWRAEPLVTLASEDGHGLRLAAVNDAAAQAGLAPGMAVADARALEPGLHAVTQDREDDLRALAALADWCGRYSPWTAVAQTPVDTIEAGDAGGLWLDVTGCAHLFGGEEALLADLLGRLAQLGYAACAGLADTPGAAWATARFATDKDRPWHIVPPGGQAEALRSLPIAGLRLDARMQQMLVRLSLRTIAALMELSRAGLATRFGAALPRRLDQALGHLDEPISPRRPRPSTQVRLAFPDPIGRPEDIAAALHRLADALCVLLDAAGLGARRLELRLFRAGGWVDRAAAGTSRASRDPAHITRLIGEALERLPEPGGDGAALMIDALILAAPRTEKLVAEQGAFARGWRRTQDADAALVATLVDRLASRLGTGAVARLTPRQSHLPERAQVPVPALPIAPAAAATSPLAAKDTPWPAASPCPRPVRLLARPEPVEAIAPVPDDPPRLFRWRGRVHRVVHAQGPERLAPEWWRAPVIPAAPVVPADSTRDYYRVEDLSGARYWLYREGLYQAGTTRPPRWYLHGVFG